MNTDKILPIDLYHAVSTANLTLESTLKIIHVEVGQDHELLPLEPGTLAVAVSYTHLTLPTNSRV